MKYKEEAEVISKKEDAAFVWLTVRTKHIARESRPGQFVNIRAGKGVSPLLRRPFSIADTDSDFLTLIIQKVGPGSKLIADTSPGDKLNIIGPLGNSFPASKIKRKLVFVAGGV